MTTTFTIAAGIFGLIAIALHRESPSIATWLFTVLAGVSFLCALYINLKKRENSPHFEERKLLLNSCLEIIDARTRLTIELVDAFRGSVKKYRYALTEEQREFISHLLNAVGNVRINDEELKSDTISEDKRKEFISKNRVDLNKIEKAREVIEGYLSENT